MVVVRSRGMIGGRGRGRREEGKWQGMQKQKSLSSLQKKKEKKKNQRVGREKARSQVASLPVGAKSMPRLHGS
jgi:hypothetical protein